MENQPTPIDAAKKSKKTILTVVAVVAVLIILIVSAVGVHVYNTIKENRSYIGEYYTYDVTGSGGGYSFSGTYSVKIVDANYSSFKVEYKYQINRGGAPFMWETDYEWISVKDDGSIGIYQGTETITNAKYGTKVVSVYLEIDWNGTYRYYVGSDDIMYRILSLTLDTRLLQSDTN